MSGFDPFSSDSPICGTHMFSAGSQDMVACSPPAPVVEMEMQAAPGGKFSGRFTRLLAWVTSVIGVFR